MKSLQGRRTPSSRDECRTAPDGRRPLDLESWYSFYHPTEGRRLSRPRWLVIYPDGLPAHEQSPIQVLTGRSVN